MKSPGICRYVNYSEAAVARGYANPDSLQPKPTQDTITSGRYKTELCKHFIKGLPCNYGKKCNYAHGYHELKLTSLKERHENGMIDANKYRNKPCMMFVATGSCPFGDKCDNIHDTRATGEHPEYKFKLKHYEFRHHKIPGTTVYVDSFRHKDLSLTHDGNPFGTPGINSWTDFNKTVCEEGYAVPKFLTKAQKIQLTMMMRGCFDENLEQEKYKPTSILFGQACMVVQRRLFDISYGAIREVSPNDGQEQCANSCFMYAYEIDFGPHFNGKDGRYSIWFNLDEANYLVPFPESFPKKSKQDENMNSFEGLYKKQLYSDNSTETPISLLYPNDHDAFDLITDVLKHQLATLKIQGQGLLKVEDMLQQEEMSLKDRFDSLMTHFKSSSWPAIRTLKDIDDSTPVPAVRMEYNIPSSPKHEHIGKLWRSFLSTAENKFEVETNHDDDFSLADTSISSLGSTSDSSLAVFRSLRKNSFEHDDCGKLPTMKGLVEDSWEDRSTMLVSNDTKMKSSDRTRCWKSILLNDATNNDWDEVHRAVVTLDKGNK